MQGVILCFCVPKRTFRLMWSAKATAGGPTGLTNWSRSREVHTADNATLKSQHQKLRTYLGLRPGHPSYCRYHIAPEAPLRAPTPSAPVGNSACPTAPRAPCAAATNPGTGAEWESSPQHRVRAARHQRDGSSPLANSSVTTSIVAAFCLTLASEGCRAGGDWLGCGRRLR